jgi:glutamate decarboxylase
MAAMVTAHPDFELTTEPELNILTYRFNPASVQAALGTAGKDQAERINDLLDQVTRLVQKAQREAGKTFVSRTRLRTSRYHHATITVFRVVLANPLTTDEILSDVLAEQCAIVRQAEIQMLLSEVNQLVAGFNAASAAC